MWQMSMQHKSKLESSLRALNTDEVLKILTFEGETEGEDEGADVGLVCEKVFHSNEIGHVQIKK